MLKRCFVKYPKVLVNNLGRGLTSTTLGGEQNHGSSRHYSSNSSNTNSSWSGLALGVAVGTAGLAYMLSNDQYVAHCGSSDHWVAPSKKSKPTVAKDSTSTEQSSLSEEPTTDTKGDDDIQDLSKLPTHVPYLIIGAGTSAMAAYRAIRTKDANAKVLLIGEEEYRPYMRPPLSKDMWFTEKSVAQQNKFTSWSGKDRSIFFENDAYFCQPGQLGSDKGGVAVATGLKVVKLDAELKRAVLSDGTEIGYDRCLLATGGQPRNLPSLENAGSEVMSKVTLFRGINDFRRLDSLTDKAKSVLVIGGGFLGSELACALGKKSLTNGMTVTQVFPESGNMGRVLPTYLSNWTTDKVRSEHVTVIPGVTVEKSRLSEDGSQVEVLLSDDSELSADHVVVAVGLQPNTDLAESAGLEVDERMGGFLVNAELEAATDIWVAGDAACFYDVKLGRRRVEHHDHAVVSGRLAGENMTGASRRFLHQSMFWSDLGPDVGYEAIGLVDSELPTVAVFAKASTADTPAAVESKTGESLRSETEQNQMSSSQPDSTMSDKYGKGVIFYMKGKRVVGVLCWNVFNKIGIARKIIKDGAEHDDLTDLAKMFDLHASPLEASNSE